MDVFHSVFNSVYDTKVRILNKLNKLLVDHKLHQVINIGFIGCEGKCFPNNMMVLLWRMFILNDKFIITHDFVGG